MSPDLARNPTLRRTLFAAFVAVLLLSAAPGVRAQEAATTAVVEIPSDLLMTTDGSGFDNEDNVVVSTGGPIDFTTPDASVSLPIPVPAGLGLLEYDDMGSGTTVTPIPEGHVVRIPIKDAEGNDTIRILLTVEGLTGTGDATVGTVRAIEIDLPTRHADLTSVDPRVGTAGVKVLGSLSSFPGQSGMTMTIAKEAAPEAEDAFTASALEMGLVVDEIAFAAGFAKIGLDESIASITLQMALAREWVDDVGIDNVRVFRRADDGTVEVLDAPVADLAAAAIRFDVASPNGLSTFVIAAVSAAPTPTPTATPAPTATPTPPPTPVAITTATVPDATATPTSIAASAPTATPTSSAVEGEDGGGSGLLLVGLVSAAVVLAGAGIFMARRRR